MHRRNAEAKLEDLYDNTILIFLFDIMVMTRKTKFIYIDLCKAVVAINVPCWCLDNVLFVNFLENCTNQNIPDKLILRKNYLQDCCKTNYSKCAK